MLWAYVFGVLWGFGGLMCGLALRYLGLSLGQSISLGVCAIVGTLVPAVIDHKIGLLFSTIPGAVVLLGFVVCLVGIALCGYAGVLKEQRLTDDQKKESVKDFALVKGLAGGRLRRHHERQHGVGLHGGKADRRGVRPRRHAGGLQEHAAFWSWRWRAGSRPTSSPR